MMSRLSNVLSLWALSDEARRSFVARRAFLEQH